MGHSTRQEVAPPSARAWRALKQAEKIAALQRALRHALLAPRAGWRVHRTATVAPPGHESDIPSPELRASHDGVAPSPALPGAPEAADPVLIEQSVQPESSRVSATPQSRARLLSLLLASVLALPAFLLAIILWAIWTRTPHVPFYDEWALVPIVQHWNQGALSLGDLWAFHNEHRIFLPRILQLIMILTTHWNRQIEMTFDLALSVVEATLLYLSLRRFIGSRILSVVSILPLSLLVFSLSQYENWLASFQITFILTALGVAMCVYGLGQGIGRFGFAIALVGAVIAALSSLGGLVAFIAFLPAVFVLGYRKIATWIIVAAGIGVPYVIGFPHSVPGAITPDLVLYVLGYLGAPVGFPRPFLAIVLAAYSFVLAAANLAVLARHRQQILALLPWLGLALFALGDAVSTALGRLQLESVTGGVAYTRYHVFSALWWVFILAILLKNLVEWHDGSLLGNTGSRRLVRAGVAVTNSLMCSTSLICQSGQRVCRDWW